MYFTLPLREAHKWSAQCFIINVFTIITIIECLLNK